MKYIVILCQLCLATSGVDSHSRGVKSDRNLDDAQKKRYCQKGFMGESAFINSLVMLCMVESSHFDKVLYKRGVSGNILLTV